VASRFKRTSCRLRILEITMTVQVDELVRRYEDLSKRANELRRYL